MKNIFFILFLPIFLLFSCASNKTPSDGDFNSRLNALSVIEFNEIWGYVFNGCEKEYSPLLPITDIGYFTEAITTFSKVPQIPPKEKYFSNTNAKVHLVSSCDSRSQTHLLLSPSLPLRDNIIEDLITAAKTYDGLQIDWELVSAQDADNYMEFLKILKSRLKGKTLSVAIPARIKTLSTDAYNYSNLAQIADRIVIMAYDQHWSTSEPGPIAGTDWCKKITDYAKSQIPQEKLIMGLSFYGRTWRDDKTGGKAYSYNSIQKIIEENKIKKHKRDSFGVPSFNIEKKLKITAFYDDEISLLFRTKMYAENGIDKISFWRTGQEDKNYWQHLKATQEPE